MSSSKGVISFASLYPTSTIKSAVDPYCRSASFIINTLYKNPLYLNFLSIPDIRVTYAYSDCWRLFSVEDDSDEEGAVGVGGATGGNVVGGTIFGSLEDEEVDEEGEEEERGGYSGSDVLLLFTSSTNTIKLSRNKRAATTTTVKFTVELCFVVFLALFAPFTRPLIWQLLFSFGCSDFG